MTLFHTLWTDSRPQMAVFVAATVAAASVLVLVALAPDGAHSSPPAAAGSTSAEGDVLFWSRSTSFGKPTYADGPPFSIVKASAAKPSLVATVLAATYHPAPYSSVYDPEVSPDGTRLAYIKRADTTRSLEVRNLATGSTTVLVRQVDGAVDYSELREPTWSPDGETIAYVNHWADVNRNAEVRAVEAAGGPVRMVDPSSVAAAWRPDGRLTVARIDPVDGTPTGLWITGTTPDDAVLIPGSAGAREHAWSPDGTQVAFNRYGPPPESSIETLPAGGGTPTVINNGDDDSAPAWSSDGQRVYFKQGSGGGHGDDPSWIMQVPRTGGTATTVASGGQNFTVSVSATVPAPVSSKSHDLTGDGYADVIGRMPNGDLRVYLGTRLGLTGSRVVGIGWSGMTAIFTPGDFDGDGHLDVIGRLPNGDLRLYTGLAGGPPGSRIIGTGWNGLTAVFSPGDFTSDGHPDVIARMPNGDLRLYYGTGTRLSGSRVIGTGWNGSTAVFSPGDFTADGHPDVIARMPNGDLRVYFGTGTTLSGSAVIGTGWNGLSALFSPGDYNLDGRPDVIGRISNGDLLVYYGTGTRLSGYHVIGTTWKGINPIL